MSWALSHDQTYEPLYETHLFRNFRRANGGALESYVRRLY
jgi:hypothetical protein